MLRTIKLKGSQMDIHLYLSMICLLYTFTIVNCNGYESKTISSTLSPINRRQFNLNGPSSTPSPRDFGPSVSVLPPPGPILMQYSQSHGPMFRGFHSNQFQPQSQGFGPTPLNSPPLQQVSVSHSQPFQFNPGNVVPIPSSTVNVPFIQYVNKLKATYFTPPKFNLPPSSPFKFNQDYLPQTTYSLNSNQPKQYFSSEANTESEGYPRSKGRYQPYGVSDTSESFNYKFSPWRPVNEFNSEDSSGQFGSRYKNFPPSPKSSYNSDYNYEDSSSSINKDKDAQFKVLFIKTTPNSQEVHFPGTNNGIRELDSSSHDRQRASVLYLLSKEGEPKLEKVVRVPLPNHPFSSTNYGPEEHHSNVLYVRYNKPYSTVSDYGVKDDYYDSFDRESKFNNLFKTFMSQRSKEF